MRYRNYLILFNLMLLLASPAMAQDSRYRVELIILTHLDRSEEPREHPQLPDYSDAIDFLTPVVEEEIEGEAALNAEETTDETIEDVTEMPPDTDEALSEEEEAEVDPNRVEHIEEMSDVMQESWRRLRLSAPFRPEVYLSWEQGSEEPFPALRVHDLETVMVDDPWADLRADLLEQATVFTDTTELPTGQETVEADEDAIEEPAIPDPIVYYRLDGTASLTRTRFLHLELDLQLREPLWDPVLTLGLAENSEETESPRPSSFLVHSMRQSRQVRSGRMEYFDGPVLGVLAYITTIKLEEEVNP